MKAVEDKYYYLTSIYASEFERSLKMNNVGQTCSCNCCDKCIDKRSPTISLNPEIQEIKHKHQKFPLKSSTNQWIDFLDILEICCPKLPNIPIIDTIVFKNKRQPQYMFKHMRNLKIDRSDCQQYQKMILQRKREIDLEFMKKQYITQNPGFVFSSLDHEGQMIIRGFIYKLCQTIPEERKTALIKISTEPEPFIVSQKQIRTNINTLTNKRLNGEHIEYIQIFPIPSHYQQFFRVVIIPFDRQKALLTSEFKQAQYYFPLWQKHSDVLHKSEQQYLSTFQKNKQRFLKYITYKLVNHIHAVSNIRIDSMIAQYYVDRFQNYYLKNVKNICWQNMNRIMQTIKMKQKIGQINKEDYIDLKQKMLEYNGEFKQKLSWFKQIDRQNEEKIEQDKAYSQKIIKQIRSQSIKKKK